MGIVSEYLFNLIAKQVDDYGLVVWYDPEGIYAQAIEALDLPDTTVLRYEGSFINLRWMRSCSSVYCNQYETSGAGVIRVTSQPCETNNSASTPPM